MQSTVQNGEVTLVEQSLHMSNAKDKNLVYVDMSYYWIIENIQEADYTKFRVIVLSVNRQTTILVKKWTIMDFTFVNFNKESHRDELFILASQAK